MITVLFDEPFYTGGASSTLVPGSFPVALGGRPYVLDEQGNVWEHQTIPLMRYQVDQSTTPGEQSINPHGLWRRTTEDWSSGSGQLYQDHRTSDPARFFASKGVDPWTVGQITLLPDTGQKRTSVNTNLELVAAGPYLYLLDGDHLYYTTDVTTATPSWVEVIGVLGATLSGATTITTDGKRVWVSDTVNTYYTNRGDPTFSVYPLNPQPVEVIAYVKGRLVGATGPQMWEFGAAGTAPTSLGSNFNPDFAWVSFSEGPQGIYGAGFSGDKSTIYYINVDQTTTALSPPVAVSDLPAGEVVRSVQGYLGFLMIGSDLGLRFSVTSSSGTISLGDLIDGPPVFAFEPHSRFCWYGWSDFDATSTGLGRLDLRTEVDAGTPAYASDLMATAQGTVTSIATFQNIRVFCVAGAGVFGEITNVVPTGFVTSGLVSFGLSDLKTALYLETATRTGGGNYQAAIAVGDGQFVNIGGNVNAASSGAHNAPLAQTAASTFTIRHTLTRDTQDPSISPRITRWTLLADVHAQRRVQINVPLRLYRTVDTLDGIQWSVDTRFERQQVRAWLDSRQVLTYQEGLDTYPVIVEDFDWKPYRSEGPPDYQHSGTLIVQLRTV